MSLKEEGSMHSDARDPNPGTSGCAKLWLEVETTFFLLFGIFSFCFFRKITMFHGWGFGC